MKHLTALLAFAIVTTTAAGEGPSSLSTNISSEISPPLSKSTVKFKAVEYHPFTTENGTITARPVGFSEPRGEVELLTEDSSRQTVELQELSEKDQAYIQDWYSAYSILEKRRLRISLEEETLRDRIYGTNE